jgi:conjugative transposon TraM protein
MSINFRQPKYILPLIALPFLCLFFYVYHSGAAKDKKAVKQQAGFNGTVADVSPDVKKRSLEDKLDAYRDRYKEADGASAVTPIPSENSAGMAYNNAARQKRQLDSIDSVMKRRFSTPPVNRQPRYRDNYQNANDRQLADALNKLSKPPKMTTSNTAASPPDKDPMELFKKQMAYLDSVRRMSDPAWQKQQQEARQKAEAKKADAQTLSVVKASQAPGDFNTVMPDTPGDFIKVVVDESITGYAGSRLRLRLLDDIEVGQYLIRKDSYLYALINGFSGQRVTLQVKSIIYQGKILPVKLDVYDLDGLPGLYVPESAFRDFTKDLGQNTVQGVTIDDSGTGSVASQFMMSTVSKMFESTSSAIAGVIRKDKAKIKYNSYLYLIDTDNSKNK